MKFEASVLTATLALAFAAGCAQTNPEWEKVRKLDTPEAYAQFEKQFPTASETALARTRRAALLDEREWRGASRVDTAEAYAAYIAQHPSGMWIVRARARQAELIAAAPPVPDAAAAEAIAKAAGVSTAAPEPKAETKPEQVSAPTPEKHQKSAGIVTLQLGAFSSAERAQKSWREAQGVVASLRNAKPNIVRGEGSSLYRLRIEVDSRAEADRVCAALRKAGASCIAL